MAMTGPIDYVSDGKYVAKLENGVETLSSITGSGCMAGKFFYGSLDHIFHLDSSIKLNFPPDVCVSQVAL